MKYSDYKSAVGDKSGFVTLKDGENRLRLVSEAEPVRSFYEGKPRKKFVAYAIDRSDGKVKPFTFGATIFRRLGELSVSSEYAFDSLPPYDIIVKKTGTGKETEYSVDASRKDSELTQEEIDQVKSQTPISELARKLDDDEPVQGDPKKSEEVKMEDIPVINTDDLDLEKEEKKVDEESLPF